MKKKVFSLMMTLLLAFVGVARADVVTIGDGTSSYYYYPVNMYFNYSLTEQIYTPDEIGTAGTINSISFQYANSSSFSMSNVTLYMKNVTREAFASNTDMEPLSLSDIVWTGTFSASGAGWVTITLDTPFQYDGVSNLLVAGFDGTSGYPGSAYKFYTTPCTGYKGIHWYSDSYTPDPYNTAGGFSGSKSYTQYRNNIQLDITPGGGGGGGFVDHLHVKYLDVVDSLNLGVRPAGAWMEPFSFTMYSDGPTYTVTDLDFTPSDGMFTVSGEELPFQVTGNNDVDLMIATNCNYAGVVERQFVAFTEGNRAAHIWPIVAEFYEPLCPDVWEVAYDFGTIADGFSYTGIPSQITPTELHNDYTLPFPEIPEGVDAVYKFTVNGDMILNAHVDENATDGKVALYTEDFYGEGGPMATNNYQGLGAASGATAAPFEATIGVGSSTTGYFPYYTLYNYSIAENLFLATELAEAGVTSAPMTSLSWYATNSISEDQVGITIWMANVDDTEVNATSVLASNMTKVYTGSLTSPTPTGWVECVFNEGNFAWDGHSNVLILCQRNCGDWTSSIQWQAHNPGFYAQGYLYTDSAPYDVNTSTYTLTRSNTARANVIMKGGNRNRATVPVTFNLNDSYGDGWNGGYIQVAVNGTNTQQITLSSGSAGTETINVEEGAHVTLTWSSGSWDGEVSFTVVMNGETIYTVSSPAAGLLYEFDIPGGGGGGNNNNNNNNAFSLGSAGPVIEDLPLTAGTYYLVASATQADYTVYINADDMPCPAINAEGFAFNPFPADNEDGIEPASVTLQWMIPEYATGWRLYFGSTYYPDPNHSQTVIYPEEGWETNMVNSYTVRNLWNNTNYFWRVEFNNGACEDGVSSPVWGFTTHLNIPQNLTAEDYTVFNDEQVVLHWNAVADRTYRYYFIYRDGVKIGETAVNQIGATTYTDGPLAYNMNGYTYHVTAVYDEGESAPSNTVNVKVSGRGNVNGHVYEQDGTTGIAGATVTMVGQDEFGVNHTYNFTTNGQGYYTGAVYAGSYNGQAACSGYQTITEPVQGNPIAITYNETTSPVDYILDENFDPVCSVLAEYYPDPEDVNAPYVKVSWGCGLPGEEIIEPFETGDFSLFDWQLDPTYPWQITTTSPYEGTYCMKSGGAGVASVTSNMSVTVNIPADGLMSFFGKISSESNYDYGKFYIDGVQKGNWSGAGSWAERQYEVTAGDHTFMWQYTKDSSVNSNDDCFYVDYITFYKRPEPAIPGMTYDFEDGTMQGWTSVDADGDGYGWYMGSEIMTGQTGNNGSSDFVLSQSYYMGTVLYPDNYLVSPQVQLGGIVRFYACAQDASYAAEHFGLAVSTTGTNPSDFTTVQEWTMTAKGVDEGGKPVKGNRSGRAQGNWYEYTVDLSAYSGNGYVAIRHFNCSDMFYLNVDDITIGEPGKAAPESRRFSHYRVYRTNCYNDGPYTLENTQVLACEVTDTVYIDTYWNDPQLTPPGVYKWGVGVVYVGNRGEEYESPISWTEPMSINNDKGNRDDLTNGFENGLDGWTVIDANNDGYTWCLTSAIPTTWTYYSSITLDWYHTGSNAICSGSYINGVGALTPNDYLVSPQLTLSANSQISFWVAATDASYPADHFGVFVSTSGTNPSDFTSVQEWTLTAKKAGLAGGAASRDGQGLRLATWYNYTVNLGAYAGPAYVAFRHFNCNDQYIMCIDDITISNVGGGGTPTPPSPGPGGQAGTQVVNFENGIPTNWVNTGNYPWVEWTTNPNSGSTCLASGNYNVASSESAIEVTETFVEAGSIEFYSRISSESATYDHGNFYIDGANMLTEGGTSPNAWTSHSYNVTAGTHTFRWSYTKDSSVNSGEDRYYIDDVTFTGVNVGGANGDLQEPRESEIVWSNCLDKNMYVDHVSVNVLLNSADSPEGTTVTFTNYNEYEQQTYGGYNQTLDESGYYEWTNFRKGEYLVKVEHTGYEPITDSVSIWSNTDLRYVMIEIIYGIQNLYVSRTGWAMWEPMDPNAGGNPTPGPGPGPGPGTGATSFAEDFEGGLNGWNVLTVNADGGEWIHSSNNLGGYDYSTLAHGGTGFAMCYSFVDYVGAFNTDSYLYTPQKYDIVNGSTLTFWADNANDSYPENFSVCVATADNPTASDFTQVWSGGAKGGSNVKADVRHDANRYENWRSHSVDLSAYAGQSVYIAFHDVNYDMYEVWIDDVALTAGAKDGGDRHLEYYKVMCTSIDGVPIFNHNTVHPFCQLSTDEPYNAPLVEGEHYLCKVAVMYSTGMSAWSDAVEWEYQPCDYWGPVDEVDQDVNAQGNHITWVFEHGFSPWGGGTPTPGPGGNASTFDENFDAGMPAGWTTVDADGDGYTWVSSMTPGVYHNSGVNLSGTGHNSSEAYVISGSYANGLGYALTPDNFLVSPQVTLASGSTFSFWACAQDASWAAEHFGVAISDNGTSNWTMVNEWTMTAKSGGVMSAGRNGQTRAQGNWYQYTVDLSNYAGQKYIGIRHFNCTDMFILNVDDITLTAGTKDMYAQPTIYSGMSDNGTYTLNIADIANYDERVYFLYNLTKDARFDVVLGEVAGSFIISANEAFTDLNLEEAIVDFSMQNANEFARMDKVQAAEVARAYKSALPNGFANAMMMDIFIKSRENNTCAGADPFCTDNGMYEFPAGVNAGSGESGPDYDCLYTTPNPAWYYMRIGNPGDINIYMYSTPAVDIDFCCWGPFDDPTAPCPYGLTEDKVVSCSYSANPTENCLIPSTAQTGEYYILVITNYSNQACNINFSKVSGAGDTDCGILPPVDILGFLITQDGEYLAFVGPTEREYTDIDEFGNHEYCVRVIYPGPAELPSNNYYFSMSCPVCEGGIGTCAPGAPIHGEALTATDQVKIWWGEENPGPGPGGCEGDEFTVNFESGMPAGWTTIDADGDGVNWMLASTAMGTGYGHNGSSDMIFSQSFDNNTGALHPDNYLVSPAVTLCEGSTFSFWACAQDAAWASEHFGVAISDDGVNFGMVQEWTMTAKGDRYDGPRGTRDQGNWYQYTVNLGDYAGEGRYIAIRHFNCTDMFYIDVDDIELSNGAKSVNAGIVKYNVYRSTEANGTYTMIGEVAAVAGQTYYEYIDTPAVGTYFYQVRADYGDCESEPAQAADNPSVNYVSVNVDAITEYNGVALYPNPTKGNVTIQATGMSRITVVSMLGQVVYDTEVETDEFVLNMAQFNAGMYMVRVTTTEGTSVQRVTVVR